MTDPTIDPWVEAPAYAPSFGEYRRLVCEECEWESAARTGLSEAWRITRHYNAAHPDAVPGGRTAVIDGTPEARVANMKPQGDRPMSNGGPDGPEYDFAPTPNRPHADADDDGECPICGQPYDHKREESTLVDGPDLRADVEACRSSAVGYSQTVYIHLPTHD